MSDKPRRFSDYAINHNPETGLFEGLLIAESDERVPIQVASAVFDEPCRFTEEAVLTAFNIAGEIVERHPAVYRGRPAVWGAFKFIGERASERTSGLLSLIGEKVKVGLFVHAFASSRVVYPLSRPVEMARIAGFSLMSIPKKARVGVTG